MESFARYEKYSTKDVHIDLSKGKVNLTLIITYPSGDSTEIVVVGKVKKKNGQSQIKNNTYLPA